MAAKPGGATLQQEPAREDDGAKPDSEMHDQAEAEERRSVSADIVHEAILIEGREELERATSALFFSGLAAGLSISLSMVAQAMLQAALPDTSWRPLIASLGYTVGFVVVVMGRQQLFTENTLTPILPLLRDWSKLPHVLRLWAIVLLGNLLGALAFAYVSARTQLFESNVQAAFAELGHEAIAQSFWVSLLRAAGAGWLIALMVWMLPGAESARLPVIVIPTFIVAVLHFGHSIAGSTEVMYLVASGQAAWSDYFLRFLAPVLLGNVLGGIFLVALLNHAQVVSGEKS
jgi:formate/nitrite transporter FocA (FNT family)